MSQEEAAVNSGGSPVANRCCHYGSTRQETTQFVSLGFDPC